MRSRRERKVPERLEAGPATSKWSSGTVGGSAEKAPRARSREAEQGAAQPVAVTKNQAGHRKTPKPAATTGPQANRKRGVAQLTGNSSAKKQRRASSRRTSHSAANRSTPSRKNDKTATEDATSSARETDNEDQESEDGHEQQSPHRRREDDADAVDDDAAKEVVETAEKNDKAARAEDGHKVSAEGTSDAQQTAKATVGPAVIEDDRDSEAESENSSDDSNANLKSPKTTSSDNEEVGFPRRPKTAAIKPRSSLQPKTDDSGSPPVAAGVARKSPMGFLHHRPKSTDAQSMDGSSMPVTLSSGAVPSAQAPLRKHSALSLSIPTATATPASAAAIKSAATAAAAAATAAAANTTAQAESQAQAPATGITIQAGAGAAASASAATNASDQQREAATAAVVDALLRHPIQKHPWSQVEHARFLDALHFYHRDWRRIALHVGHNRTVADVRMHSQIWNSRSTNYGT